MFKGIFYNGMVALKTNEHYNHGFNDELEKLSFKFPWQKKKKKKKKSKITTWKEKFASDIKATVSEHNLDIRFARGFARLMTRRGI